MGKKLSLLLIILLLVILFDNTVFAQTISGDFIVKFQVPPVTLSEDTYISGKMVVEPLATLIIEDDVTVVVEGGDITIDGFILSAKHKWDTIIPPSGTIKCPKHSIIVNGSINFAGRDGVDGADGSAGQDGQNGTSGDRGHTLNLFAGESISVKGTVSVAGGKGGDGGDGGNDTIWVWGPGNGGNGGDGGNAGQAFLTAKYIKFTSTGKLVLSGGAGGAKGTGGKDANNKQVDGVAGERGDILLVSEVIGQTICDDQNPVIKDWRGLQQRVECLHKEQFAIPLVKCDDVVPEVPGFDLDVDPIFVNTATPQITLVVPADKGIHVDKYGLDYICGVKTINVKLAVGTLPVDCQGRNPGEKVSVPVNLSGATDSVVLQAIDANGNISAESASKRIIVDTVKPTIQTLTNFVNGTNVNVSWQCFDSNLKEYYLSYRISDPIINPPTPKFETLAGNVGDGEIITASTTNTSYEISAGYNKYVSFKLQVIDKAGNSTESEWQSTVTKADITTISAPTAGGTQQEGYWISVPFISKGIKVAQYKLELFQLPSDMPTETRTIGIIEPEGQMHTEIFDVTVPHASYQCRITTLNQMGEATTPQLSGVVNIPNNSPVFGQLVYPVNGRVFNNSTKKEIHFSAVKATDGDNDLLTYELYLDGQKMNYEFRERETEVDFAVSTLIQDGTHTWRLSVADGYSGPISSLTYTFKLDTVAPSPVSYLAPTESKIPTILLKNISYSGDTVKLHLSYDTGAKQAIPLASTYSATLPAAEGIHTLTIYAEDAAGNINAGLVNSVILDYTAPNRVAKSEIRIESEIKSLKVTWPVGIDAGISPSGVGSYKLRYRPVGATVWTLLVNTNETAKNIVQLLDNQKYEIQLVVVDKAGNESLWSDTVFGCTLPAQAVIEQIIAEEPIFLDGQYQYSALLKITAGNSAHYQVRRYENRNLANEEIVVFNEMFTNTVKDFRDTTVQPHHTYEYQIVTYNENQLESEASYSEYKQLSTGNHAPTVVLTSSGYLHMKEKPVLTARVSDVDGDELESKFYIYRYLPDGSKVLYPTEAEPAYSDADSYQPANIAEGKYEYIVEVSDGEAITRSEAAVFYVDLTSAEVILSPDSNATFQTSQVIKVTAADLPTDYASGVKTVKYYWNNDAGNLADYPLTGISAPAGVNRLNIIVEDFAGNISSLYGHGPYKVDNTPPAINTLTVQANLANNQYYSNGSITVTWQDSDTESGITEDQWIVLPANQLGSLASLPETSWNIRTAESYANLITITQGLTDGETYFVAVRVKNGSGLISNYLVSPGIKVDSTAPLITFTDSTGPLPARYSINSLSQLTLRASVVEAQSSILSTGYAFVTSPTAVSVDTWYPALTGINTATLADGMVYYLAAQSSNILGLSRLQVCPIPIYYDNSVPVMENLQFGSFVPGTTSSQQRENDRVNFSWKVSDISPLSEILYKIGTTVDGNNITNQIAGNINGWLKVTNLSPEGQFQLSGLNLANGTYHLTLKAVNSVGLFNETHSNPLTIDSTLPPAPVVADEGVYTTLANSLRFTVSFTEPLKSYLYQVMNQNGVAVNANWVEIPYETTTEQSVNVGVLSLVNGLKYYVKVKGIYPDGTLTPVGISDGITVDMTLPVVTFTDGDYHTKTPSFTWNAVDQESSIVKVYLGVGSTCEGLDISNGWVVVSGKSFSFTNLPNLVPGHTYFATSKVVNGAGQERLIAGDGFIIDDSTPPQPVITVKSPYVNLAGKLSFNWQFTLPDPESGLLKYQYDLLQSPNIGTASWKEFANPTTTSLELSAANLVDGQVYYLALRVINRAGGYSEGVSAGVMVDALCPDQMMVNDLTDYQESLTGLSATYSAVDQGTGIGEYRYSIYTYSLANPSVITKVFGPQMSKETSVTQLLTLAVGNVYYFTVEAFDNAGNISAQSSSDGVLIDNTPGPTLYEITDEGTYTDNNTQLTFSWGAECAYTPLAKYQYALTTSNTKPAANLFKDCLVPRVTIGANEYNPARATFAEGVQNKYYLHVKAINRAGKETYRVSDGIVIDSTAPTVPVISRASGYTGLPLQVSWSSMDAETGVKGFRYVIGTGPAQSQITGDWVQTALNSLSYSDSKFMHTTHYYLTVQALNHAGSWSNSAYWEFIVDILPPSTPVVTAPEYVNAANQLRVNVTSKDGETAIKAYQYAVYLGNTLVRSEKKDLLTPLSEMANYEVVISNLTLQDGQTYTVKVQTQDNVGLWSAEGISNEVAVDLTKPVLSFSSTAPAVTNGQNYPIQWKAVEAGTMYYRTKLPTGIYLPVQGYDSVQVGAAGNQTLLFTQASVGMYTIEMYMIDFAGNRSAVNITKNVRVNAAPVVVIQPEFNAYVGSSIAFTVLATDPDGSTNPSFRYEWNFGDGTPVSTLATPEHVYVLSGDFNLTVKVYDVDGGFGQATAVVHITNTLNGSLKLSETWSGEVALLGNVTVPEGVTLTIIPGTRIFFKANTGLTIDGTLLTNGTVQNPAIFTLAETQTGPWNGIYISDVSSGSVVKGILVEKAKRGLTLHKQIIGVDSSTFRGNEIGIHLFSSSPRVTGCALINNSYYGIKEDGINAPIITLNYFSGNKIAPYYQKDRTLMRIEVLNTIQDWDGNIE